MSLEVRLERPLSMEVAVLLKINRVVDFQVYSAVMLVELSNQMPLPSQEVVVLEFFSQVAMLEVGGEDIQMVAL
jgi:hypothetical protein